MLERYPLLTLKMEFEFPSQDIPAALDMYRRLYIKKYSSENTDYSESFLGIAFNTGMLTPFTLRDQTGKLIGFVAFYENYDSITAPLIGYEEGSSSDIPVYRILMIELLRYALTTGKLLNWSSGVAEFKLLRGASLVTEIIAVRPATSLQKLVYGMFATALANQMISDSAHRMLKV